MKGFTIIELLVSIAVIGIIFSISVAGYRGSSDRYAGLRSAQTIAQAVRDAQSMALSGEDINCTGAPANKPCKYSVYAEIISPDRVTVFADGRNGNPKNNNFDVGEEIKVYRLEDNVLITQLFIKNASKDNVRILIEPPDLITTFQPPPGENARIVITGGKSITIERGGSVDIN